MAGRSRVGFPQSVEKLCCVFAYDLNREGVMALPAPKKIVVVERAIILSQEVATLLAAHCAATGEKAADVVADAVILHLDALDEA